MNEEIYLWQMSSETYNMKNEIRNQISICHTKCLNWVRKQQTWNSKKIKQNKCNNSKICVSNVQRKKQKETRHKMTEKFSINLHWNKAVQKGKNIHTHCQHIQNGKYKMLNHVITIRASKMTSHCTGTVQMREESESGIRKWEEMWFKTTAEDGERGAAVTSDERLFYRWVAET